jgi:hypothetical protein
VAKPQGKKKSPYYPKPLHKGVEEIKGLFIRKGRRNMRRPFPVPKRRFQEASELPRF